MRIYAKAILLLLASAALSVGCQKENSIIPNTPGKEDPGKQEDQKEEEDTGDDDGQDQGQEDEDTYKGLIPQQTDNLPRLYINTPKGVGVDHSDKTKWTELCTIEIKVTVDGKEKVVYQDDSLKIRGRGNSTWTHYPKKPYRFNLDHKANFLGSGQTKKWVLLANWMDRTLLRNDVAFEAARRTSIEWTPTGTFVEFYLDGVHLGNYWMGEKINVENGNFLADYLYQFDTSDGNYGDFQSSKGVWSQGKKNGGIPVHLKYPDLDEDFSPQSTINASKTVLTAIETDIYSNNWANAIDIDSFIDWLLVHELCMNGEPRHPKSCYFYSRDGKLYAGPVWDFDWGTFTVNNYYSGNMTGEINFGTIYFGQLLSQAAFKQRLKERWEQLKPEFQSLSSYIDQRAELIRESEAVNHTLWPFFGTDMNGRTWNGNPLAGAEGIRTGEINFDEKLSFQEAVDNMKSALSQRIDNLDNIIRAL